MTPDDIQQTLRKNSFSSRKKTYKWRQTTETGSESKDGEGPGHVGDSVLETRASQQRPLQREQGT